MIELNNIFTDKSGNKTSIWVNDISLKNQLSDSTIICSAKFIHRDINQFFPKDMYAITTPVCINPTAFYTLTVKKQPDVGYGFAYIENLTIVQQLTKHYGNMNTYYLIHESD